MMSLGFAFALLLTLQGLQVVSMQTFNILNEDLSPSPTQGIPDSWLRGNDANLTEEDVSGDYYFQPSNQPDIVTTQYNGDNVNVDSSPQTTLSTTENNETLIQQNNTNNTLTENPYVEPAATNGSNVNLTETNTTSPSPGNSTTTTNANTTANATTTTTTTTASGNVTTTRPPQDTSYTTSNSTTSTSVVLFNETSSVSTTNASMGNFDIRGNMNGGLSSDTQQQTKSKAWAAILGIGVGVALIGLVVYVVVKRRNHRDFSHRKLVEEMPGEPVLRLDNGEPLDLKFDGFAYYNPGLQGDNIQMTNFPKGHNN